jgi:hypothetical protein
LRCGIDFITTQQRAKVNGKGQTACHCRVTFDGRPVATAEAMQDGRNGVAGQVVHATPRVAFLTIRLRIPTMNACRARRVISNRQ